MGFGNFIFGLASLIPIQKTYFRYRGNGSLYGTHRAEMERK